MVIDLIKDAIKKAAIRLPFSIYLLCLSILAIYPDWARIKLKELFLLHSLLQNANDISDI